MRRWNLKCHLYSSACRKPSQAAGSVHVINRQTDDHRTAPPPSKQAKPAPHFPLGWGSTFCLEMNLPKVTDRSPQAACLFAQTSFQPPQDEEERRENNGEDENALPAVLSASDGRPKAVRSRKSRTPEDATSENLMLPALSAAAAAITRQGDPAQLALQRPWWPVGTARNNNGLP